MGHALIPLEVLVLDTSLVDLDTLDGDDALLRREEPRGSRGVREQEPARHRPVALARVDIVQTERRTRRAQT